MRAIVCGGRGYSDKEYLYQCLDDFEPKITEVVQGGQTGADALAKEWAIARSVPWKQEDAEWSTFGLKAGPIRNRLMLAKYRPEVVIAFPGGVGTADMCRAADLKGVPVARM